VHSASLSDAASNRAKQEPPNEFFSTRYRLIRRIKFKSVILVYLCICELRRLATLAWCHSAPLRGLIRKQCHRFISMHKIQKKFSIKRPHFRVTVTHYEAVISPISLYLMQLVCNTCCRKVNEHRKPDHLIWRRLICRRTRRH
jgi:hypothetical protein